MDMMAMAFLFDMASRNRRLDERFDIRAPACEETFAERMFSALFRKRRRTEFPEDCDGARGAVEIDRKPYAPDRCSRCLD